MNLLWYINYHICKFTGKIPNQLNSTRYIYLTMLLNTSLFFSILIYSHRIIQLYLIRP